MAELIGKSIQELGQAPTLLESTNIAIQREGSSRAEKTQLGKVTEFLLRSNMLQDTLHNTTNSLVKSGIAAHTLDSDPHGDKAYSNGLLASHLLNKDPHGDRGYTDDQITSHSKNNDPHGDRAFASNLLNIHSTATDPHGDRAHTTSQIKAHSTSLDPHGDRAYALNLLLEHTYTEGSLDPHGDRTYSDAQLRAHKEENDPHGLYTKVLELISQHNSDNDAHSITNQLGSVDTIVANSLNQAFNQKIGVTIPSLLNGLIPDKYIRETVVIKDQISLPTIGEVGTLYVDTTSSRIKYWNGSQYVVLSGGSSNDSVLSTDNIVEGADPNKRFLTTTVLEDIKRKIDTITDSKEGTSLFNTMMTKDGRLQLKNLKTEGAVQIVDNETSLTLKTNDYTFLADYNENVKLVSDTTILEDIDTNDMLTINGSITATNYKSAGDMRLVNYVTAWDVKAVLATQGISVPVQKPSGIVISSNGLVVTGVTKPTHDVEIYNSSNDLIGSGTSLTEGSFTVVLNTPELKGARLKVYTVTPEGNRSEPTLFFTNNTTSIIEPTSISITKDGKTLYGVTSRAAEVTITDSTNTVLGSGIGNDYGNFTIKLNKTLITNDTIRITAKLGTTLTSTVDAYVVNIKDIQTPYDITYNYERTVFKGKAEPNSVIEFTVNERRYVTTTNNEGDWIIYSFGFPVETSTELVITVKQEERIGSTAIILDNIYATTGSEPPVIESVTNFETKFLIKEITPIIGSTDNAELDIVYNNITKSVDILGKNKDGLNVKWVGQLNIIKDTA